MSWERGAVRSPKGGWMRLEDYCNVGAKGSHFMYTSSMVTADEELLVHEVGERVVNAICEKAIDGWDALLELSYAEYQRGAA